MEKHRSNGTEKRRHRLLKTRPAICVIYIFIIQASICSLFLNAYDIQITQSTQTIPIKGEVQFSIYIYDSLSLQMQFDIPKLPPHIYFISQKKTVQVNPSATVYTLTFSFFTEGVHQIPDTLLYINGTTHTIVFPPIEVTDTTASVMWYIPENQIQLISVGDTLIIELQGKHIKNYEHIAYTLPENALLEQINIDENTAAILARFLWTPLFSGIQNLPVMQIRIPNGKEFLTIETPAVQIPVAVKTNSQEAKIKPAEFIKQEFEKTSVEKATAHIVLPPLSLLTQERISMHPNLAIVAQAWESAYYAYAVAQLRTLETDHMMTRIYHDIRIEAETALQITDSPFIISTIWIILSAVCTILLFISFFICKKKKFAPFLLILCILCTILSVCVIVLHTKPYAVFTGGAVYAVPDTSSSHITTLNEGVTILQRKKAGSWILISYDKNKTGWIQQDRLIK